MSTPRIEVKWQREGIVNRLLSRIRHTIEFIVCKIIRNIERNFLMAITSAIAAGAATGLVKNIIDEIFNAAKTASVNKIASYRSDIREAAISKALTSVTKIKTIWNVEKEVSLYEFFYATRVEFPGGVTKAVKSLRELGIQQNYVLQGTAGQGKSVFLRYLSGQELKISETTGRIPIFVELRRLRADFSLKSLILQALEKYKLPNSEAVWSYLAGTGKFVLLLDAFDEIEPSLADRAVSDIEEMADIFQGKLQIIVTSRPDADIQRSSRFRVIRLAPLEPQDHLPFLERICPEKEQAASLSRVIASSSTDIKGLLTTPLMMTLLVILYKSLQTVPDTLPKFYEELFDVLFYRHDQAKPGFRRKRFTSLDDSKFKKIFSALCFVVRLESHGTLTAGKLRECIEKASAACNESVDPDRFRDELTKTVCLMLQDGLEYSFIHKSVTQYYAASFVRGSAEAFAEKFYTLVSEENRGGRWDLELKFLAEIDSYRFMKWREIPLLKKAASKINYSFDSESPKSEAILNEIMFRKISFVARKRGNGKEKGNGTSKIGIIAWSRRVETDPVVEVLAAPWARRVLLESSRPEIEPALLAKISEQKMDSNGDILELTGEHKDLLESFAPDLAKTALLEMQERYDRALSIVNAEEGKSKMLSKLFSTE